MASTSTRVGLKLLVDKKGKKVLFAEVGKEFVDFLFYLLSLPIGTVVRLLNKRGMVGCLTNLYQSVENLSDTYMQPNQSKDSVLKPKSPLSSAQAPFLLTDAEALSRKLYMCASFHLYASDDPRAVCPSCKQCMKSEIPFVAPSFGKDKVASGEGGFVKGLVTYMVMDDLVVEPMSTISSIMLLNKFNVKDVVALEEKVVDMGMAEGLKLLQASLQSKTVLTNVFLRN
ncbi:hypothetical protein UlMin_042204 [Ulmus minor]